MSKAETEKVIAGLNQIPAIPAAVTKLIAVMDDPDSTVNDIVSAMDTSTCVKVLSIANSAYYSRLRKVESIEHAIAILGRNTIRDMVVGIAIVSMFNMERDDKAFDYNLYWHKTIISTQLSMMFGKILKNPELSKIYTVGLLHDLGEIVFFLYFKNDYKKMLSVMDEKNLSPVEAEKEVFGLSHAEVGRYLAEKWSLPEDIARIINSHEEPHELEGNLDDLRIGMIIHSADLLTKELLKDEGWEEIFEDDEKLKQLFSSMNSEANDLIKEIMDHTRKPSASRDWSSILDEELAIVSEAVNPIMKILLSN